MKLFISILIIFLSGVANAQTGYLGIIYSSTPIPPPVSANNIYVNNSGNDTNTGTLISPFKTIAKVNSLTILPGTTINFAGGQTFNGMIKNVYSGKADSVITFRSYGTGKATINGVDTSGILLKDCEYISIKYLNFQGSGVDSTNGFTTNTGYGIIASSTSNVAGYYNNISVDSCVIDGFRFGMYFNAVSSSTWRGYNGIRITNSEIKFCAHTAIWVLSNNNASLHSVNKNIYISRNYIHNMYGNPYASTSYANANYGTGIRVNFIDSGLVEYNRIDNAGYSGTIWGTPANFEAENASNIVWQFNESSRCIVNTGFISDGAGFDVWDGDCQNMLVQYNYIHNNDGYGLGGGNGGFGSPNTGNVARFNLLVNNNLKGNVSDISIWGGQVGFKIYNNTVFNKNNYAVLLRIVPQGTGGVIANNIFVHTGINGYLQVQNNSTTFLNNSYWINNNNNNLRIRIGANWYDNISQMRDSSYEKYAGVNYGFGGLPTFTNIGDTSNFLMSQNVSAQNAYNITGIGVGGYVDFSSFTGSVGTKDFHNTTITTPTNIGAVQ